MNYVWLVEEFGPEGSSTGRYMRDRGSLAITYDVYAACRLRREMSAAFRALDMEEKHGGDWRPVEHGFLPSPVPAPQAEPQAAQPEAVAWLIEWNFDGHGPRWWGFNYSPGVRADFCQDPNKAIRFSRREDAERMRMHVIAVAGLTGNASYERSVTVTEHMWSATPPTEPAPQEKP